MKPLIPFLLAHRRFVLTTHVNPDGDAIGSEIALASWLTGRGKDVTIVNISTTPYVYRFLDPEGTIHVFDAGRDPGILRAADVIAVVDTNHPNRTGSMEPVITESPAVKICIDHHLDQGDFAQEYFIDTDATSTGELLYRLLDCEDDRNLSPVIAQALYCAIMTDTGSFRYPRVDADVHRIVARLIEGGADPVEIYRRVYDRWSDGRIRLLGEALSSLRLTGNGKVASITITRDMLRRTGTMEEDTDNFTTYPMSIDGVVIGMLFVEISEGLKISFRSRGEIPINLLAKEFGGNGHKNAAGARLVGMSVSSARETIVRAAEKYLTPQTEHHQ
jgi:phosphoesterase RecJ-like protein